MHGFTAARMLVVAAMLVGMVAFAAPSAHADRTVDSALFVSKSENKNQVHYAIHVDDTCTPVAHEPVYAYWRMYEKSATATEPLLEREQRAYGIARQEVRGDTVRITLAALPSRPITIHVARSDGGNCTASAEVSISGSPARLFNVHVALGFMRVNHLVVTGWAEPDGRVVRERIAP